MEAFEKAGYRGWRTVEHFKPWRHYPAALVWQASDEFPALSLTVLEIGRERR